MEENNGVFRIKMVNILSMIEALDALYAKGVDYIDLYQEEGEEDTVIFFFYKEYINEKYRKDFEESFDGEIADNEEDVPKKIKKEAKIKTIDDINKLL